MVAWDWKGLGEEEYFLADVGFSFGTTKMVMVMQLCTYNRIHLILHFKWVNFLVCGFRLRKALKKKKKKKTKVSKHMERHKG